MTDPALDFLRTLWALDHGLQSHSKRMRAKMGVTGPQRLVLRMVMQNPGIAPSEIARVLHFHKSTVTVIVDSLEGAKLLKRVPSRADGRSVTLTLTSRGAKIARQTTGTVESVVRKVLSKQTKTDVTSARELLETLARAFE
jgi:DNA-binding MarR family transcriptional regulator